MTKRGKTPAGTHVVRRRAGTKASPALVDTERTPYVRPTPAVPHRVPTPEPDAFGIPASTLDGPQAALHPRRIWPD